MILNYFIQLCFLSEFMRWWDIFYNIGDDYNNFWSLIWFIIPSKIQQIFSHIIFIIELILSPLLNVLEQLYILFCKIYNYFNIYNRNNITIIRYPRITYTDFYYKTHLFWRPHISWQLPYGNGRYHFRSAGTNVRWHE